MERYGAPEWREAIGELASLAQTLGEVGEPVEALWSLVNSLRQDHAIDRAGVFAFDRRTRMLHHMAGVDRMGRPEFAVRSFPVTDAVSPLHQIARRELTYYFSQDAPADYPADQFAPGLRALAVLPIVACDQLVGMLKVDNSLSDRPMDPGILDTLWIYASLASVPLFAIYQKREGERLERLEDDVLREVLQAVSGGKVWLCSEDELTEQWKPDGAGMEIRGVPDIPRFRAKACERAREAGLAEERVQDFGLCASEAATNALVHGRGGIAWVQVRDDRVAVVIRDSGEGIVHRELPRATMLSGWFSGSSAGVGFTLMKEVADSVLLATGPAGTTLMLAVNIPAPPVRPSFAFREAGGMPTPLREEFSAQPL